MSCFKHLVDCKFIANARLEILRAKRLLINDTAMFGTKNTHHFNYAYNKQIYYQVGNNLGFFQELYNIGIQKNRIYYLQYDKFLMIASNNKRLIETAITATANVNGDFPLFRSIHTINKIRIHTVLFNTEFTLPPPSLN